MLIVIGKERESTTQLFLRNVLTATKRKPNHYYAPATKGVGIKHELSLSVCPMTI